jgi:hypothetical protein
MSGFRFLRNVLLVSIAGLIPPLALFVVLSPGLSTALGQGGPALLRFLRQVLTNGLPVVFVINYVSLFLYALSINQMRGRDLIVFAATDVVARLALFFGLHTLVYVLSADWYDSFGGDRLIAISVVAPTLARSAYFENVSGVYFYATFVSAMPLYVTAIRQSNVLRKAVEPLPFVVGPFFLAAAIFVATAFLITLLAEAILRIQG